MIELIKAVLGLGLQMLVMFSMGSLLMRGLRMKTDISQALLFGYLAYFALFEIVVLPAIFLWVPLRTFSLAWGLFLLLLTIAAAALCRWWKSILSWIKSIPKGHSLLFLLLCAVVLLQCGIVIFYQDTTVDATYYVGTVTTSVYTGTLGRYNPYNGALLKNFDARYVFAAYPMHNAVWSELLGLHPIVQAKMVMPVINTLVINLLIYQIAKKLFQEDRKKADLMVAFVCLMQLFLNTLHAPARFLFTRSYEGKSLLANLSVLAVFYCILWFWQKAERNLWVILFLVSLSAVNFSGSSMILAVGIAAGFLPILCLRKQFKSLIPLAICVLPEAAYLAIYYGVKAGLILLRAS
jgi:hypothetical protein